MGELIGVALILLGVGITFYTWTNVSVSNHELRIQVVETLLKKAEADARLDKTESKVEAKEAQRQSEIRTDKLEAKMDQVITAITELKVEIQNKQDKQ